MNPSNLILSIGTEGSFELASPFTNALHPQARYTVRSIRTMSDIIASGGNPQDVYYTPNSIPEADYLKDLQADVCIIGLQATSGEWVYVPQSYIVSMPNLEGASYRPLALVIPLGMTRDDKDLTNLKLAANALVMSHLGVQATSTIVSVGAAELVSLEEDTRIQSQRALHVTYSESEAAKQTRLERENASQREQLQQLANYIKSLTH